MSYQPTISDIPKETGYQPTLVDIPNDMTTSQKLLNQSDAQGQVPTQDVSQPDLSNLTPAQSLLRQAYTQGQRPQEDNRKYPMTGTALNFISPFIAPEVKFGAPILKNILNAASRAGTGTATNVANESQNIHSMGDLARVAKEGALTNAMMEVPGLTGQTLRGAGEIYRPGERYATQKMNDIRNEAAAARQVQQSMYKPIFAKYGAEKVAIDGKNYLNNMGIKRVNLYPEARLRYDNFLNDPSVNNLHSFQSQLFKDISKTNEGAKPATVQRLRQFREKAQEGIKNYLQKDPAALEQYLKAGRYTRNVVEPYEATNALRKITGGTKQPGTIQQMRGYLKNAAEQIKSGKGVKAEPHVPMDHQLRKHLSDIDNAISRGEFFQNMVPENLAKWLPNVGANTKNAWANKWLGNLKPLYYGAGRTLINDPGLKDLTNSLSNLTNSLSTNQ